MLLVPCPHCGPRNAADLRYIGPAHTRPDPNSTTPEEWRSYLYLESNPADWISETWHCRSGCRRYFKVQRHTVTNQFSEPPLPGNKIGGGA